MLCGVTDAQRDVTFKRYLINYFTTYYIKQSLNTILKYNTLIRGKCSFITSPSSDFCAHGHPVLRYDRYVVLEELHPWKLRSSDCHRLGQLPIRVCSCSAECSYGLQLLIVLRSDEHVHHRYHELGTRFIQDNYSRMI
jgi:hypothetical protein